MEFKVVNHFTDLKDNRHKYQVGDIYPREGYKPTLARIKQLMSGNNKLKKSLIKPIEE